jgi:hypothetical protein
MNRAGMNIQNSKLYWAVILLVLGLIISACQPKPTAIPSKPDSSTPINRAPVPQQETFTPQQIITITPVIIKRETASPFLMSKAAWLTYTNIDYGFSFQYPPQWKLLEQDKKEPHYIKLSTDSVILIIGYKWSNEDKMITGGGTLPGTLESGGYATLAGQLTPKLYLIEMAKLNPSTTMNQCWIPFKPLHKGLYFQSPNSAPGSDYHTVDIPESTQKKNSTKF